ncbi:glucosaminidase domain-containing protein, partial [Filifactor villosus]
VGRHCDYRATNCPGKYFPWKALIGALKDRGKLTETKKPSPAKKVLTPLGGKSGITREQAILHINKVNRDCKISVKLSEFVEYYFTYCEKYGVRTELAIAQMLLETNYLRFGGIVKPEQNNFAGIGALDGNGKGQAAKFKTAAQGVLAHVQHLYAYCSIGAVPARELVDPRFGLVRRGSAPYLEYLSIPNNPGGTGWASDKEYAMKIKDIAHKMDGIKVQKEHWGAKFIRELQEKGIISESHDPDSRVTWAEFAAVLSKVVK